MMESTTTATTANAAAAAAVASSPDQQNDDALSSAVPPPPEKYKADITMKMLVNEMNAMRVNEREQVFEEVHGVSRVDRYEDPESVSKALEQFDFGLSKQLLQQEWPAYRLACQQDESYITAYKFRIMFLRAEKFDIEAAVKRSLYYLERKLEWFGPNKLTKDIQLSDMNKDDMATINTGSIQFLPHRDRSGRVVMWDLQRFHKYKTKENIMRWCLYLITNIMQDEESQKLGMVIVVWQSGRNMFALDEINRDLNWEGARFMQCMPARLAAVHLCFADPRLKPLATLIIHGAGKEARARAKIHEGTDTENLYSLMTFGIPIQDAPIDMNGNLKLKHHKQWLQKYKKKEKNPQLYCIDNNNASGKKQPIVKYYDIPCQHDVLLGKGKPIQEHFGNVMLHQLIDTYWERYHFHSNRVAKRIIMEEIVQKIHDSSAKFLQRDDNGWWCEAPIEMAIQKVGARFRTAQVPTKPSTTESKQKQHDTAAGSSFVTDCCGDTQTSKRPRLWQEMNPSTFL